MLFFSICLGVAGYSLIYAAVKGNAATINGTPLWRAPWLPFVAAITGGKYSSASTASASGTPAVAQLSTASGSNILQVLATDFRNLGNGLINAVRPKAKAA